MSAHQRQESRPIQRLPCALSILTITLLTTPAMADSRQGFVLGGGTGPGFVTLGLDGARENKIGVSTDLTVGYGLTEKIMTYAMSRIIWFNLGGELTFSETAGAGVTYFFADTTPSLFVAAGFGAAVFVQPNADTDNQFGLAGLVGIGYEARQHWLIEVDVAVGNPGDMQSTSLMAKLNYYYY